MANTNQESGESLTMTTEEKNQKKDNDIKMYILVNSDLNMGKGKIAGQVGHVVGVIVEEIIRNSYELPTQESLIDYTYYQKWIKNNAFTKVVLKATETELRNFINTEKKCRYIIDVCRTHWETKEANDSLTGVGFFPRDDLEEKMSKFKLL
jgi:peptidyl-tRNA hydrolase